MRVLGSVIPLVAALGVAGCNVTGPGSGESGAGDAAAAAPPPAAASSGVPITGPRPQIAGTSNWSGAQSAAFNDMFVTARDERGWRLLWQLVGEDPPGPLPEEAMGLAVFLGARPTAGYRVEIAEVLESPGDVTALYRETTPPPGAVTSQILTAPYAITLVPMVELPVHYDEAG